MEANSAQKNGDVGAVAPTKSSVQVTQLSSRSVSSLALQAFIRPLRKQLLKGKPQPPGSPTLSPPSAVHEHCNVHEHLVGDIHVYDVNCRSESTFQFVANTGVAAMAQAKIVQHRRSTSPMASPAMTPRDAGSRTALPETGETMTPILTSDSTDHFHPLTRGATDASVRSKDWALHHDGQVRKRPRQIYYFSGGSWSNPPGSEHWKLAAHLARTMTRDGTPTTVSIVSYPLAPHTKADSAQSIFEQLYWDLFPRPQETFGIMDGSETMPVAVPLPDPEIILAGDSSGGNIALALTLHMLNKFGDAAPAPKSLMLISPTVDMRTKGREEELGKLEKKDPLLSFKAIRESHDNWCGTVPQDDPWVSPIFGDLSVLRQRGVSVNGVNGGYDILGGDIRRFIERLKEERVPGQWLDWDKQIHCFPLTFAYGFNEGKKAVEWMINVMEVASTRPRPTS